MAGVRCIRKPAAPGKPRPAPPLATGATDAERLPEAMRRTCRKRHNALPPPAPHLPATAPLLGKKTPPPHFYAARSPMKKREPFVPGKTAFRNPLCRTIAKLPDTASTAAKTGAQRGLKCFQRENLQKIRRNTGQKTRNGRKAPPREYSGRPYLMTKKIPLPDRQRDPY